MEKEKTPQSMSLLDEVAALKILGGTSPEEPNLTVYIGSGCKKDRWADCKKICPITTHPVGPN